jgi:hypothetical protein
MEIVLAEEKIYLLPEKIPTEQAKERAWGKKTEVFGTVAKLIQRPKSEDVEITYNEKRYEPFWHVDCKARFVYDRNKEYSVAPIGPEVQSVTIDGQEYAVEKGQLRIQGVEHCSEEHAREAFVDGITGEKVDLKKYLEFPRTEIASPEKFDWGEALVVPPKARASVIVREMLSGLLKPLEADKIMEERVEVSTISLYYRPIYAYEYLWKPKDKKSIVEFDGLTGEMRTGGKALRQTLEKMLTKDLLFDVGADALSVLVPGGGIAVKVARAVTKKK